MSIKLLILSILMTTKKNSTPKNQKSNISYSSIDTQRKLRIQKVKELRKRGIEPFTPYSQRDFSLGFVKFWFNFVHKFDLSRVVMEGDDLYTLDYFLHQVMFPRSLLEKMEDKLQLRHTFRQMGLDPDTQTEGLDEEFESDLIDEARNLLPVNLLTLSESDKIALIREYLRVENEEEIEDDTEDITEIVISFKPNAEVTLAGRIKSKRVSGRIAFATVEDESAPEGFQFIFRENDIKKDEIQDHLSFKDFKQLIDEGDYVQATGVLDYSQRGEPSLFVREFQILTKAIRPLPEKMEYTDLESRYLDRVADFKMNTKDESGLSVRDIVRLKARYWRIWREEMYKADFLEVECPILEHVPGGADTTPFTTFYEALDQQMYLSISLELPLKKLIAGGFERVFEIGRIFRNEGVSPQHLQDYTQIEWYWAYTDYYDAMDFIVQVYRRIANEILGTTLQTDYYGNEINWGQWCSENEAEANNWEYIDGWPAITYFDAVRYYSKKFYPGGEIDIENKTYEELLTIAKKEGVEITKGIGLGNLLDKIYKKVCRPYITNPIFLFQQPVVLEPLAKRDPDDPDLVHRWQVVVGTAEMGKAFSELNDPLDQHQRLEAQQEARDGGDNEAQMMNEEYVKALEYGLPPLSGFGVSERLLTFLLAKNIKEGVTFPAIRSDKNSKITPTNLSSIIILDTPEVEDWVKMNASSHLAMACGAMEGRQMFDIEKSQSKDGEVFGMNTTHAIINKKTDSIPKLWDLKRLADKNNLRVTVFTRDMLSSSDDKKVHELHLSKSYEDIELLGVLVYGKKSVVEKITKDFQKL